jgi:2-polyprenyl-3-methyl-5-hydroxy-6-metoxy-1,4-benzoquinol methylase
MKKRIIPPGANQTKESYNRTAENFKERFENYQPYRKSVEKFISILPAKCHILDVGCGPGINARRFIEHGYRVTGIDYTTEMIKIAKASCRGGTFLVADLNDINLRAKYNAICASFVIVHLSDEETNQFLEKLLIC